MRRPRESASRWTAECNQIGCKNTIHVWVLIEEHFGGLQVGREFKLVESQLIGKAFDTVVTHLFGKYLMPLRGRRQHLRITYKLHNFLTAMLQKRLSRNMSALHMICMHHRNIIGQGTIKDMIGKPMPE